MTLAIVMLIGVPAIVWLLLLLRITKARKDRAGHHSPVGGAFDGMLPHDLFSRDLYTEEGKRLIPWLRAALILLAVGCLIALGLVARGAH